MRQKLKKAFIWSMYLVWILGIRVSAAEGIEFHIENQTGKAGDLVTVPVELKNGGEVGGFDVKVYYDPESMEFQELKKGELIREDGLFDYNHKEEEASIKIIYVVSDMMEADGTLVDLVFRLKKDCESLPMGMNLAEVIDSSEEGNIVTGQVTGTDASYQEQINQRVALEGGSSTGVQEEEVQGGEIEGETEEGTDGQEESVKEEKNPVIEEVEKPGKDGKEDEKVEKNQDNWWVIGVGVAVFVVIIGSVMWKRRMVRKGNENED